MTEKPNYNLTIPTVDSDVFWTTFGNKSRLELKNGMFQLGKLSIGFQKFDNNNKQTAYITSYIDLDKALGMCDDIVSGRLYKKTKSVPEGTPVYKVYGGQKAEKAKRSDNKPLSREFSIARGRMWILKVKEGPGKVTETGGIAPDGPAEREVAIGLSDESIRIFALMFQHEYDAFRTTQFLKTINIKNASTVPQKETVAIKNNNSIFVDDNADLDIFYM